MANDDKCPLCGRYAADWTQRQDDNDPPEWTETRYECACGYQWVGERRWEHGGEYLTRDEIEQ